MNKWQFSFVIANILNFFNNNNNKTKKNFKCKKSELDHISFYIILLWRYLK
jgi:hypothetical protein